MRDLHVTEADSLYTAACAVRDSTKRSWNADSDGNPSNWCMLQPKIHVYTTPLANPNTSVAGTSTLRAGV